MRCWMSVCCGMMLVGTVSSARATDAAAENFSKSAKASEKPVSAQQRAIAEFDTDGDGKLSAAERRAARMALAKKKRSAASDDEGTPGLGPKSTSLAGSNPGYPSGMNPYAVDPTGYGGMNPYLLGNSNSGSYFYYAAGAFGQTTPGQTGMGGGCMSSGSMGGSPGGRR
jgi:hypothetical protein